ncbi:hypothetical protein EDC01DRAFT_716383 [Geopyxis carbonaria]|nr:hypothetical protein EDC01DRAFT_716383 [Geopyxis carbonaria]
MAALVQTFPAQQSSTPVGLMQPRSQSSSGALHSTSQAQVGQQHNLSSTRYRDAVAGNSGYNQRSYNSAPVAPYAFTSTPGLSNSKPANVQSQKPRDNRSSTAGRPEDSRQIYTSLETISPDSSVRPPQSQSSTRSFDTSSTQQQTSRPTLQPLSTGSLQPPQSVASPTRPSPERYRRNRISQGGISSPQSAQPSGSGMAAVSAVYTNPNRASSSPSLPHLSGIGPQGVPKGTFIGDYAGQLRSQSVDDIHTHRSPTGQQPSQNRRRSVGPGSITAENFQNFLRQELSTPQKPSARPASPATSVKANQEFKPPVRPGSRRTGSTDSSASGNSSRASSSNRNSVVSNSSNPANPSVSSATPGSHEINPSHVPPRGSSTDVNKRITAPSPLSRPVNLGTETASSKQKSVVPDANETALPNGSKSSSAAEHLAALNDGQKKGMKNRLRRAFSFGSAAELRKASAANNLRGEDAAERARARQDKYREEQDTEQARIARRQEEAGLGESIYSGQGNFFTGSTDNISVSSTASSASIMIRKMGKGVKRSTRSLVGLFRPKSVTGVAPASGPVAAQPSTGQVSMITVEAEREIVNVNAHPSENGGGTGYPKLERNSMEMGNARRGSAGSDSNRHRRSIVGSDKDRAEILASVKKGILKRSGSASPITKPHDTLPMSYQLPEIPNVSGLENQRPTSHSGDRPQSLKNEVNDYFMTAPKIALQSNSAPTSPNSLSKYNVSFSPRITFHDTWPSGEYDRRGEVATCNRLTPMLAQQIKEELNTFKMEMDVHEESKVYTHFF